MDITLLASLAVIHIVALMSPGPDFAIVVKMATQQTRLTAVYCALGIAAAILVHTLLSLLGISVMIQQSPLAYMAVQLIGSGYLAWMGLGALTSALKALKLKRQPATLVTASIDNVANISSFKGFKTGLYTNLLNPKALIFFITLFTVLITPQVSSATKIAAAILLFSLSFIWFGLLALVLSKPRIQQKLLAANTIIDLLVGVIFITVAITIAANIISDWLT
ncbi:LysE family transporter [Shewanella inventionis]|uniref:Lysine transporter LysE n=1 Tax=Shewanella inventionis TaxID=1738770 RepID=A0ABQ1JTG8_9GAMM|nr:LysE family transporter [Shewanella inventionis]MCL1159897.1 LysE family transporter [Shewanella inventionis]UAL42292.1 LysE family transporter [Shewanella inventionis]GGB75961.1 lysine transporter LysE [Shewanella inventionis]